MLSGLSKMPTVSSLFLFRNLTFFCFFFGAMTGNCEIKTLSNGNLSVAISGSARSCAYLAKTSLCAKKSYTIGEQEIISEVALVRRLLNAVKLQRGPAKLGT